MQGVCQLVRVTKYLNLQDLSDYDMDRRNFLDKNKAENGWKLVTYVNYFELRLYIICKPFSVKNGLKAVSFSKFSSSCGAIPPVAMIVAS